MSKSKIETYLGFCIKARKIALGAGAIETLKKGVCLIIVCSSASENCFKLALKYKKAHSCPLMICNCGLENAVHKPDCKLAAVRDISLANAIIANACEEYEIYAGGTD